MRSKKILVTGAAGFIGYHLCRALLDAGHIVVGLDNLNDYYSVSLKENRLKQLEIIPNFRFIKADIRDESALQRIFSEQFNIVVNLAAYSGVRHSIKFPDLYIDNNIKGFLNVIEACRQTNVGHFVFASSSSVYGLNPAKTRCRIEDADSALCPVTPYALTKKMNEELAKSYACLFKLRCTGVRLFSVYGPWGRPDMAYFAFAKAMTEYQPVHLYNNGNYERDYTYIDDATDIMVKLMFSAEDHQGEENSPDRPARDRQADNYGVFNVGSGSPMRMTKVVSLLQQYLKPANVSIDYSSDVLTEALYTHADLTCIQHIIGQKRFVPLEQGMKAFVDWYVDYHQ